MVTLRHFSAIFWPKLCQIGLIQCNFCKFFVFIYLASWDNLLSILSNLGPTYVFRHRRLKRNFVAFASRYSPASGAAILNVDDDADDSPIIRGFSDDEPLVVT